MTQTVIFSTLRLLLISLLFLIFTFNCTGKTDIPECDGDGETNGCPDGEYCGTNNTCQQDCAANSECDDDEVCNENGECVSCQTDFKSLKS